MSERRGAPWAVGALVFAALVPLLWPGDVPFIHDEPQLVAKAVAANAEGRLAPLGLLGTFGVTYGPLPVWMYQALLWVTHDLVPVALAHAALMAFVSAGALWSLARTLGLWPGFAAVPLLTPYFWFYARVMWDNTLLLPLAALAYAGYAAFLGAAIRFRWITIGITVGAWIRQRRLAACRSDLLNRAMAGYNVTQIAMRHDQRKVRLPSRWSLMYCRPCSTDMSSRNGTS